MTSVKLSSNAQVVESSINPQALDDLSKYEAALFKVR
jgi:hypothetical protein